MARSVPATDTVDPMGSTGAGAGGRDIDGRGHALLLAAVPSVKGARDATAALPPLAAVPPSRLVGAPTVSTVQLVDPENPQAVLTHLRTAAAAPGPLLVFLAGHLWCDTKQRLPHLALARSTARTVRYTGLPWHWLATELRHRSSDDTVILTDLTTDPATFDTVATEPRRLAVGVPLYGVLTAVPPRSAAPSPLYSRALAALLRTASTQPPVADLHDRAVRDAGLPTRRTLLLGGGALTGAPSATVVPPMPNYAPGGAPTAPAEGRSAPRDVSGDGDPHPAILEAARSGRHREAAAMAAAWEREALRRRGPGSLDVVHWTEVSADLARIADEHDRACALWMRAASGRLAAGQDETHPDVVAAVDRAHHCWRSVTDPEAFDSLGADLLTLRSRVPGDLPGALRDVRGRLAPRRPAAAEQPAG